MPFAAGFGCRAWWHSSAMLDTEDGWHISPPMTRMAVAWGAAGAISTSSWPGVDISTKQRHSAAGPGKTAARCVSVSAPQEPLRRRCWENVIPACSSSISSAWSNAAATARRKCRGRASPSLTSHRRSPSQSRQQKLHIDSIDQTYALKAANTPTMAPPEVLMVRYPSPRTITMESIVSFSACGPL
jgi:hypothetical protein